MMNRDYFSANDINKYTYCSYQWYYEKVYGQKELRRLYNERNKELGLDGKTTSNLVRGQKFHSKYYKKDKFSRNLKLVLFFLSLILGIAFAFFYYYR